MSALAGKYTVMIASDMDHERVYAEIYCDGRFVVLVSQESGLHSKMLEFPGPGLEEGLISRKVDLEGFQRAVELAAGMLDGEE